MKRVFSFFAATTFLLSIGLSSCVKEDPAKPMEINWNKTGVVTGKLLYVNDMSVANPEYKAPPQKDIEILATIPYNAIVSGVTGTYVIPKEKISYQSGEFTIETPVGDAGGTVTIRVSSFYGSKKVNATTTQEGIWYISNAFNVVNVLPGQTTIDTGLRVFDFTEIKDVGSTL